MPTVRKAIQLLEKDDWHLTRTRGSHRILKHPVKRGIVVVAGKPGFDLPLGTWKSTLKQAGLEGRNI
ncbi:MAG: type II toxin-antitoxin system HicA family toxin [Gemmatimonadota bacterium]|nr:type II toxin-antitoxin system HicA family toxin [Gemmatimonadota bacterium]